MTYWFRCISRLIAAMALCAGGLANADHYPSKTVRIVVANAAGSQSDLLARIVAQDLNRQWSQPVIVENRPGASGFIAGEYAAKAAPDGYTLMLGSSGVMAITPNVYAKLPYDALKDFVVVSDVGSSPNVLVVSAKSGIANVRGLIEKGAGAKEPLSFGSLGNGSTLNIASQLFARSAGVRVMQVPYKSEPQIINDLMAGLLDFAILPMASTAPFIKSSSLTALAVTARTRTPFLPSVATTVEAGLADAQMTQWFGLFAPAGTPPDVVSKIAAAMQSTLKSRESLTRFSDLSIQPGTMSQAEFSSFFLDQFHRYGKIVKSLDIKVE